MDVPRNSNNKVTVGYAVSITGCGTDPLSEGAAVLKHAIHQASANGNYGYKMYAIVHPKGEDCGSQLKDLGYTVLIRDTPVAVEDIKGDFLRNKIESNGCCGEKELIKLEAYTIVEHPIVVHLDLDVLILQPMDALFDYMLGKTSDLSTIPVMWQEKPPPKEVNAFFTRDYNMVHASTKYKPVQGGFLVLRPSLKTYKEFCDIIREGDFRDGKGWGGVVGPFYGSMTFQGIIPYYYDYLNPGTSLELNRCIYNQMCDNPRDQRTINDEFMENVEQEKKIARIVEADLWRMWSQLTSPCVKSLGGVFRSPVTGSKKDYAESFMDSGIEFVPTLRHLGGVLVTDQERLTESNLKVTVRTTGKVVTFL
eukprot:CAMPEP_0178915932 /NCGR_PEP_ID=MMETSP0786-20121207/12327_1 /TAXON_ID=186022 /ORGANISM="Thalassionema frauenfeldii, Strain CCMP 1798" /LENGTH=364 /DNA_ID=CAMNT_0020589149 /DNA_START=288 /DNA_END=1379 /DNA_ORIENTATION=-